MRRVLLLLPLVCAAAVVLLYQLTGEPAARTGRAGQNSAAPVADASAAEDGLVFEGGVARVPAPAGGTDGEAPEAEEGTHWFTGRAWSASKKRGVDRCTVVLESLGEEPAEWGQPPTVAGGFFTVAAPPDAIAQGELRVVIESPEGELGVAPAKPGDGAATDLGTVRLAGQASLKGSVEDESGRPVKGVRLRMRRFGELTLLPGTVAAATSDERGEFELKRVPHGCFVVAGRGPEGRRFLAVPVLVPTDGPLLLRPAPAPPLELTLRNSLDEPVSGVRVEAIPLDIDVTKEPYDPAIFEGNDFATSDADGVARFPYLRPREYTLFLTLPDGTPFEFLHSHARGVKRLLRLPADPRIRLRFVEVPPTKNPPPLKNARIEVHLKGETSLPYRTFGLTCRVVTDEEGRAIVPLIGTTRVLVQARAVDLDREGGSTIGLPAHEGFDTYVRMPKAPPPPPEDEHEEERGAPRRIRVRTAAGLPVAGATVYARGRRRKTDKTGAADVGEAVNGAVGRLARPELASGDPNDGEFGSRAEVELVWNAGRRLTIRVVDDADGFPISDKVRVLPRPSAWKRIEPGVFASRWDPDYADPEAELKVVVAGYEVWTAAPPGTIGPPLEYEARLVRVPELTARLRVEVTARSLLVPGVRVRGAFAGGWKPEVGRTTFLALTGLHGAVEVLGLAEGPWRIYAKSAEYGWTGRDYALTRGFNPLSLHLAHGPRVTGRVIDDRGHAVARARIESAEAPKGREPTVVRTDGNGRFRLNLVGWPAANHQFLVEAPGHAPASFTARLSKRRGGPLTVTLPRLGALDLPIAWADGAGALPKDLELQILVRYVESKRWRYRDTGLTARVEEGRLKAEGVPPGIVRLVQTTGSAYATPLILRVVPGDVTDNPALSIHHGATLEGRVTRPGVSLVFIWIRGKVRVARTDENGYFLIGGLPPGVCAIEADGQTEKSRRANRRVPVKDGTIGKVTVVVR